MQELIKVHKAVLNNSEINAVNAREIHSFLEVNTRFDMWIQRAIEKYDFIENLDFCTILSESSGGRPARDYIVTLDMAKELAMVENNPKGKEVRKYFIQCEKQLQNKFQVPQTLSEALLLAGHLAKENEEQKAKLLEAKPKIEFYDAVTDSKDAIDMGAVAKVLNKNIGRNKLFALLRDKKILQKNNIPYQAYIDRGYFRVIETSYNLEDGSVKISLKTLVLQRGVEYLNKVVNNEKK